MVYSYNIKKQIIDTCNNMHESQKHIEHKPDTTEYAVYDSVSIKF